MSQIFTNNAITAFSVACDAVQTTITLANPSLFGDISGPEDYALLTAQLQTGEYEVFKATAVSGNDVTVERGHEGAALTWETGQSIDTRITAATLEQFQIDIAANAATILQLQTDLGSLDARVVALEP